MRYFFHIAYDGSFYSGWQWQPKSFSVQEVLEEKLSKIFKKKISVFGCGRTDKGVHASQYFFHIEVEKELDLDLKFVLQKHLPATISLFEVIKVKSEEHTRYHATKRRYDYFFHTTPDPFIDRYSNLCLVEGLDLEAMKSAAKIIQKHTDFRGFCIQPDSHNHTECKVVNSHLYVNEDETRMHFTISGDRFLKGMIRVLVATLLKIGKREMTIKVFEERLKNPQNGHNLKPAPPNGLYLSRIEYDFLSRENQSVFYKSLLLDSHSED